MTGEATPASRLSRHFHDALFDLGFLDVEGADSFRSLIAGALAFLVSLGLLLTRMLIGRYASLAMADSAEPYRRLLLGDDLLLIALPMLVLAFVTVLLGPLLFLDETDFRVLVPLPVSRRVIFTAKLIALLRFAAIFVGGSLLALTPVIALGAMSRWSEQSWLVRVAAMWAAGGAAALFAALAVAAINGAIVTCVPAAWRRVLSTIARSSLLGALVLALPIVARLPTLGAHFADRSAWVHALPPAWFVGLERVLAGDSSPFFLRLAAIAALAFVAVTVVTLSCYIALYRRFDRVMIRAHHTLPGPLGEHGLLPPAAPAARALHAFTGATLRRSPLHQSVVIALYACGVALVFNGLIGINLTGWVRGEVAFTAELANSSLRAMFSLIFAATAAIRLALLLPIELRANWIFRMTESDVARPEALRAVARALTTFGVTVPILLASPILFAVFGRSAPFAAVVAAGVGLLLVETVLRDWQRLPFTCTWLPGKRSLAHLVLLAFTAFVVFTNLGVLAVNIGMRSPTHAAGLAAVLCGAVWILRRRRQRLWGELPLTFEDVSPYRVESMRLSVD
jgi:hypothetical protein